MSELGEVTKLCAQLERARADLMEIEERRKTQEKVIQQLEEVAIPSAMEELGYNKVELDNGVEISIKQEVYTHISKVNKEAAHQWLQDNGFGDLIKQELVARFGRGSEAELNSTLAHLDEMGVLADVKRSVHGGTLKAFVKEQLAEGTALPMDLFGARPVSLAKISAPKFKL